MDTPAADVVDAAVLAAREAAQRIGAPEPLEMLHTSNNVVVAFGGVVAKVGTSAERLSKEVRLAAHAATNGGPAAPPLAELVHVGRFAVSLWPRLEQGGFKDERAAAAGLRRLQESWSGLAAEVPPLEREFDRTLSFLDGDGPRLVAPQDRRLLRAVLTEAKKAVSQAGTGIVLHGEPHRGNWMGGGDPVFIDFESAACGPLEWDAAFFDDEAALAAWPAIDLAAAASFRLAVSAGVAVHCWRAVEMRPEDEDMRWHAEWHLGLARDFQV